MRRVIYPIEGIVGGGEFEKVYFERGASLLKRECPKLDDLYDNDLNPLENLYLYLSLHDLKDEIKELIINNENYRDLIDEEEKTYWNMPLFRNEELNIPDELFEIRSLLSNFISIERLCADDDYIIFEKIRLPKYLDIESAKIYLIERVDVDEVLEENFKSYELIESNERNVFNLKIAIDDLNFYQIHDVYLEANYPSRSPNKVRIDENCINAIENNNEKINIYATKNRRNISISTCLSDDFKLELRADDEGIKIMNKCDKLKREFIVYLKDLNNGDVLKFILNKDKVEDKIEWKFINQKRKYGFYLSSLKNGKARISIPLNKSHLIDFKDMKINNAKIHEDKNGDIKLEN